ncbi:MAG: PAS domain S-box protein [bacterium]|nr:PAS domain S-box protein [bacterium]
MRTEIAPSELDRFVEEIQSMKTGFDLLDDHVIVTDNHGNILYANKAVEKNTGFSVSEVIGKNPADLWGGEMPKEFYEKMWHTIKTEKKPFVGEVQNKKKDGTLYWQELHISPVLDRNGNITFFIGIEPDVSDRKRRDQFREEFLSILGNQGKTPLADIRWTLEWLFAKGGLTEEQRAKLQEVYSKNQNLLDLFRDLLLLSGLQNAETKREPFDLLREILSIIDIVQTDNPKVPLIFDSSDPLNHKVSSFPLRVEKSLAVQLFTNLIANAAEYADKKDPRVALSLKKNEYGYIFSAKNNGLCIPKADQPRIFSKFFRASNAKEMKTFGTGLGLYIVKLIADYFHWEVWFQSPVKDGKETIFYVKMPY